SSPFFPCFFYSPGAPRHLHSFPTRRSSDLLAQQRAQSRRARGVPDGARGRRGRRGLRVGLGGDLRRLPVSGAGRSRRGAAGRLRSEEHTSELQSLAYLVCRLLLEKKKKKTL